MKKIIIIAICFIIISISISIYKISNFSINQNLKTIYAEKIKNDSFQNKWLFFSLPLLTQKYIMILLTIPLAMLMITIFRIIIGINTFGNFTPILISFVFQEMNFVWTISFFFFIILMIYFLKNFLSKINLLFVSRLSIIITFIIIFVTILISTGYYVKLE
ncbi:MAG: 7TM domain-containing protein, partial [bacterium]